MRRILLLGVVQLLPLVSLSPFADAQDVATEDTARTKLTVVAGHDIFRTTGAGKNFENDPIPAGFFGSGYPAFTGEIIFEGKALTEFMGNALPSPTPETPENQVDTIIQRLDDAVLPIIGSHAEIAVQMVDLSLRSTNGITVMDDVGGSELWDVTVRALNNPIGSMTIRRQFTNGGSYDAVIPVDGVFTFVRRSDNAVKVLDSAAAGLRPLFLEVNGLPWADAEVSPAPGNNFLVTAIAGLTSNFLPGYSVDQGRVEICGDSVVWSPRGPYEGWHGHALTSYTPELLFPVAHECRVVCPAASTWGLVCFALAIVMMGTVLIRRQPQMR